MKSITVEFQGMELIMLLLHIEIILNIVILNFQSQYLILLGNLNLVTLWLAISPVFLII